MLIRLIYYIYNYRLLYYLPLERMTKEELEKELEKLKDFKLYVFEGEVYVKAEDYKQIAIENKKLKELVNEIHRDKEHILGEKLILQEKLSEITMVVDDEKQSIEHILELEEENKKLREKLQWWKDLVQKAKEFEYDEDGMDYIWQNTKI